MIFVLWTFWINKNPSKMKGFFKMEMMMNPEEGMYHAELAVYDGLTSPTISEISNSKYA
jgi:hypothetical protein